MNDEIKKTQVTHSRFCIKNKSFCTTQVKWMVFEIYLCAVTSVSMNLNPSNLGSKFSDPFVFLDSQTWSIHIHIPIQTRAIESKSQILKEKKKWNLWGDWRKSGGRREGSGGDGNDRSDHTARNLHLLRIRRRRISTTTDSGAALRYALFEAFSYIKIFQLNQNYQNILSFFWFYM